MYIHVLKIPHENFWSPWHTPVYRYIIYLNLNNIELIGKTFVSFTFSKIESNGNYIEHVNRNAFLLGYNLTIYINQ